MKLARDKQHITYGGPQIWLKAEFSFGNLKLRTKWYKISKCTKWILYLGKWSFWNKDFLYKEKLKSVICRPIYLKRNGERNF